MPARKKISLILSVLLLYLALLAIPQQAGAAVVKKLTFNTKQLYMVTGSSTTLDSADMRVVATLDNGLEEDVTDECSLASTKTSIFSVSGQTITAAATGSASLSATYNGKTAKAAIKVIDTVKEMSLSAPANLILQKSGSFSVKATLVFTDTAVKPIDVTQYCTWESDDDDIVSVKSGKIKALDLTSGTKVRASCNLPGATISPLETTVQVINPVKSVVAEPYSLLGTTGGSSQLVIKPVDKDGSTGSDMASSGVLFSSTNKRVATVNETGLVSFVAAGAASIKASYAGKTVSIPVKVFSDSKVLEMIPDVTNLQLVAGSTGTLKFKRDNAYVTPYVNLSSSDTTVAKTSPGKITAVAPGTAIITYQYGGTTGTINVEVIQKVSSLSVNPSTINIIDEGKAQLSLTAVYTDKTSAQVTGTYTSDNPGIATVDGTGLVTGVAPGSAKITATFAGKSITVPVTVLASNFGAITFSTSTATGGATSNLENITFTVTSGSTLKVYAQALFGNAPYDHSSPITDITSQCVWTSEDTSLATVSNGVISLKKAGVVRINATFGEKSNSFLLNIWQAISEITATPGSLAFFGSTDVPKDITSVAVKYADGTLRDVLPSELTWTSGNNSLVTVSNPGTVSLATPFKTGSTTVTGDFAGKKVSISVSVNQTITSISTSANNLYLIEGTPATFNVLAHYGDGTYSEATPDCTYSSSDPKIIVDKYKGTITAQAGASAKGFIGITLQSFYKQIDYTIIPKPAELGLELNPGTDFNDANKKIIANNGTFYFNSGNQGTPYNIYVHTMADPIDAVSRIDAGNLLSVFSSNNTVAKVGGTYTLEKGVSATTGSAVVTAFFAGKTYKFTVGIDLTPPAQPSEDLTANKEGTTQSKNFNIIVYAETGSFVTAAVGGNSVLSGLSPVTAVSGKATLPIDITKLTDGSNAIVITATDLAGNASTTLTVNVTKDITKPSITVGAASVDNGGDTITVVFNEDPNNDAGQVTNKNNWTLQYADDTSDTGLTTINKTNAAFNYDTLARTMTITLEEATDQAFIPDNKYVKVTPHATNISDQYGNAGMAAVYSAQVSKEAGAPTVTTDWTKANATHFTITYSDVLERTAATNTANWTYVDSNSGGVNISAVSVGADGKTVTVTLSGSIESGDTLQPTANVKDLAGNSVTSTMYAES